MNIFVPQSIQTQIELEELADVKLQIITPTTSRTIIGIVQDGLLGAYNLTAPNVKIDWRNAMNIMSYTSMEKFDKFEKNKTYTGQELFSLIIPPAINATTGNLKIKSGVIQEGGRLTKDELGSKKGSAIHQLIWDEYGAEETKQFIDDTQRLINNFNLYNGFTVGYGDTQIPNVVKEQIYKLFETKEQKVCHMITEIENNPNLMESNVFEFKLKEELLSIRENVGKLIMANLSPENNFNIMILSGSRGDSVNMAQICGCLGLQAVEGKMIQKKYNDRTSPYFHQNDDRGESRGLVRSSFYDGLSFNEFVFLLMAGREGLIDQAIKTAQTGYTQRRLVKSMEDIIIAYDGTVRTANGTLLQVTYGDSGANTTKQFSYKVRLVEMSNKDLEERHKFDSDQIKKYKQYKKNDEVYDMIKNMRNSIRKDMAKAKGQNITLTNVFMLPVNIDRIINNTLGDKKSDDDVVDPTYVHDKLEEILTNEHTMLIPMRKKERENKKSIKNRDEQIVKTLFKTALYDSLSPKRSVVEYKFSKKQFDKVIDEITNNYNKNIVEAGEMVGIIGAQSLGEPTTQLTLKSFHSSGIATMSTKTQGVPRILELFSVTKKPKTPQLYIYLTPEFKQSKEMAHRIASYIKYTTLGELRGRIEIYYDPKPNEDSGIMKKDGVKNVFYNQKVMAAKSGCQGDIANLPWLMRIEIEREKMLEKEVTLLDIKTKFCNWWEKRFGDSKNMKKEERKVINKITSLAVLSNSDSDKQPVIHLRFNVKDTDKIKDPFNRETLNNFIDHVIDKFKLKGIEEITNIAGIVEQRRMVFDDKTGDTKNINEQLIITEGVNLKEIRYIIGIDALNTICNDIYAVYQTYGIEIARARLLREIATTYEEAGGGNINYQHLSILVDMMTSGGYLMSVDRHGMNKSDTDPLSKASFEKSVEQLLTASVFGEVDHMKGVSSRLMAGLVIKGGTGMCDVLLNTSKIEKMEYTEEGDVYKQFTEINTNTLASNIVNKEHDDIFIPL
uniref:DNA-directed RNA polymerase n=1 Tax=viral metagenome TaxID=1070528 RepID=A0A6C0EDH0_9ZZZZ